MLHVAEVESAIGDDGERPGRIGDVGQGAREAGGELESRRVGLDEEEVALDIETEQVTIDANGCAPADVAYTPCSAPSFYFYGYLTS